MLLVGNVRALEKIASQNYIMRLCKNKLFEEKRMLPNFERCMLKTTLYAKTTIWSIVERIVSKDLTVLGQEHQPLFAQFTIDYLRQ